MKFNISYWQNKLNRIEPYYFYLFIVINLIPVLAFKLFPTVDGPAHLYNSKLIVELIKDSNGTLNDFFYFNNSINPNWFGHFLLSLFISIFPYFVAEKIVLLFYLIGIPVSIRFLFKTLSIENKYLLYLVFPFTYSFLFYYGFYNFNIGLVLFFWGLGLWIKYINNLTIKKGLILALFSTLICLSHLFVFVMFLMVILFVNISHILTRKLFYKSDIKVISKLFLFQGIALSLGLIITTMYFLNSPIQDLPSKYIPFHDILTLLIKISPAKGINYGRANIFTQWIFYIIVAFILYFLSFKLYALIKNREYKLKNPLWLLISLATLILVFIIPDSKGAAVGFNTHRFILFFFLFLIIWLASQKVNIWFKVFVFTIITYINFAFVLHNKKSISNNCKIANELIIASNNLTPNSTVLPIINSDNFIFSHISNYLGVNKPMIILENYEASLNHFPLKWNHAEMPQLLFGNIKTGSICVNWVSSNNEKKAIDYVFILNDKENILDANCNQKINSCLNSYYKLWYEGTYDNIKIFKKNCP
jgi:hypothetical protein